MIREESLGLENLLGSICGHICLSQRLTTEISSEQLRLPFLLSKSPPGPLLTNSNSEPCQEGDSGSVLPSLTKLSQHNPVHQNIFDVDENITDQTPSCRRKSGSHLCMFISPFLMVAQRFGNTDQSVSSTSELSLRTKQSVQYIADAQQILDEGMDAEGLESPWGNINSLLINSSRYLTILQEQEVTLFLQASGT